MRRDGVVLPVAAGKQRAVLAALLLSAGRVVSLADLAEVLWGSDPPTSARVTIQNYVVRLRKALGEAGRERISTVPGGYVMKVAAPELDVSRFEDLLDEAQRAARRQDWPAAAARAAKALVLWRGEPLADAGSELLSAREVPRLSELRAQATETRLEAELQLGRGAGVVGDLRRLSAVHPLRERVYGLLMLALYSDGRQSEALAVYQQARRVLVEELGTEPGAALQEVHQRVLAADPALPPACGEPEWHSAGGAQAAASQRAAVHRPGERAGGPDRLTGSSRPARPGHGSHLRDRRNGGGRQDRAGRALGASGG